MKYAFIKEHKTHFKIKSMCNVLSVSRSGYYHWLSRPVSKRQRDNDHLLSRIRSIHKVSRANYGAIKTWKTLIENGEYYGKIRVARIRKLYGIEAKRMRRFRGAEKGRTNEPSAPNILEQDFSVEQPNRVWVTDITFVPTRRGWLYLAVVLDLYSRQVVGWSMGAKIDRYLVKDALMMAIEKRQPKPGLICHSDQGVQYKSLDCKAILRDHKMIQSMSRKGCCWDNAVAAKFFW